MEIMNERTIKVVSEQQILLLKEGHYDDEGDFFRLPMRLFSHFSRHCGSPLVMS